MSGMKFKSYTDAIQKYCSENDLDFEALEKMNPVWGMDFLLICDGNDSPVLKVAGYDLRDLRIEETDLTERFRTKSEEIAV